MTACLLYDKIHKNQAENLLHLMLYFSLFVFPVLWGLCRTQKNSIIKEEIRFDRRFT